MTKVVIPEANNFQVNLINENGDQITARVHTFRELGFLSMFVDGELVIGSAPCIGGLEIGSESNKKKNGAFFWKNLYNDKEYPFVDNYGIAYELWYKQPSEYR